VFTDESFRAGAGPARPIDRVLREQHPGASWNDVRRLIRTGKVSLEGVVVREPITSVTPGAAVTIRMATPRPLGQAAVPRDALVHVDAHVVVVRKPAGIATVPHEDERDTLDRVVQSLLRRTARPGTSVAPLGVVQRLDKDTSGLIVFARTTTAKRDLQLQFRQHSIVRRYLAIAHGHVESRTIRSRLVQDRGDGLRGSTGSAELGRDAVTHVKRIEALEGATLVECVLETGRTHQIRIHLAEAGHPIVGERVYARSYSGPAIAAPRLMLHAAELGFSHPVTQTALHFEDPLPADMEGVLGLLRGRPGPAARAAHAAPGGADSGSGADRARAPASPRRKRAHR
jgi:23S rRNA pseudouridine1911/1915/1917 synthase